MQTIDILVRVDSLYGRGFFNVIGQGQLDEDTVESLIDVEAVDISEQFALGDFRRQVEGFGEYAGIGAGTGLVADVHSRCRITADQHCGESGGYAGRFGEVGHPAGQPQRAGPRPVRYR